MHYLKCIEMLEYALNALKAGQRVQVPVTTCGDVQTVLLRIRKTLPNDLSPIDQSIIDDVLQAVTLAQQTPGLINLTEEMKTAIIEGVAELRSSIAIMAFNYYVTHDFEPEESIVKIMRIVVACALEKGVLQ